MPEKEVRLFMNQQHHANKHKLVEAVLTSPGATDPALRRIVETYTSEHGGRPDEQAGKLPSELVEYVTKVALHAYKTTDQDIEVLQQAGYSEGVILEINRSAALGDRTARSDRGLAVLK